MTQALNDRIARDVILRAVQVQRLGEGVQRMALTELIRLDKILVGMIAQSNSSRLKNLLALAKEEIADSATKARKLALKHEEQLIVSEAAAATQTINVVTGAPLATEHSSKAFITATRNRSLVMGAPATEWWSRQSARTYNQFADVVRNGFITGRDTGAMVTEWRQTSLQLRREAATQVRTSVQSMANAARHELYQRNDNVLRGVQTISTLDLRTSALCRGRSGMSWTLDGQPIDANIPYPGPPPWHWNCRSTLIPIVKEFEALSSGDQRKVPKATQASMNGQVAGDLNYNDWFKTLTPAQQIEVLGKSKHALWKKGKLSMRDMIDQTGRELTIDQLEGKVK